MPKKVDLVSILKKSIKEKSKTPFNPVIKDHRERNMMQEAIDMGSHQASEIFKDTQK